jgi:predicted GTPase
MPYDKVLNNQRCQRYERLEDMDKYTASIEEREEYFSHIQALEIYYSLEWTTLSSARLRRKWIATWDGGNNDVPFFASDLHICLVDSLWPTDEEHYYPGETNVRMADMVLITI